MMIVELGAGCDAMQCDAMVLSCVMRICDQEKEKVIGG